MYGCMDGWIYIYVCVSATISFKAKTEVDKARTPKGFHYLGTCMEVSMYPGMKSVCMYTCMHAYLRSDLEIPAAGSRSDRSASKVG